MSNGGRPGDMHRALENVPSAEACKPKLKGPENGLKEGFKTPQILQAGSRLIVHSAASMCSLSRNRKTTWSGGGCLQEGDPSWVLRPNGVCPLGFHDGPPAPCLASLPSLENENTGTKNGIHDWSCLHGEPFIRNPNSLGVQRAFGLASAPTFWKGDPPQPHEDRSSRILSGPSRLRSMYLIICPLICTLYHIFNKLVNPSVSLNSVSCSRNN